MPWNLHLCVTRAATATEAEVEVWNAACDNTDPDAGVQVCGSVSETDEVNLAEDETGYLPSLLEEEGMGTIAQINEWLGSATAPASDPESRETLRRIADGQEVTDDMALWRAKRYVNRLMQEAIAKAASPTPDVFKQEFYAWDFRNEGVTHIGPLDGDPRLGKRFVVVLRISN
jgi:hypothetical protein